MMKKFKKVFAVILVVAVVAALGVMTASATDATSRAGQVGVSAVEEALGFVTDNITALDVLAVIGVGVAGGAGFAFMWFAVRWVISVVWKSLKGKGKPMK